MSAILGNRKKLTLRVMLSFWTASILVWYFFDTWGKKTVHDIELLETASQLRSPELKLFDMESTVYNDIFAGLEMAKVLKNVKPNERCALYFNRVMKNDSYVVLPHSSFTYRKGDFDKPQDDPVWTEIRMEEQLLHDQLTHLKVFDQCFLRKNIKHSGLEYTPHQIEQKLFPWLTFRFPVITNPNGPTERPVKENSRGKKGSFFLQRLKHNLQGKGVVMTLSDNHIEYAIRLIKVLRFLGNRLPIQIVYYSNLSETSKQKLLDASTSAFGIGDRSYMPQSISFVDVSRAIDESYMYKFGGFGNKILATLFNTFEDMLLMDADTVMLEPPSYFFERRRYIQTGTLFFKDRATVEYRSKNDVTFFKKLLPSLKDTVLFGIPQVTSFSLNREFFKGRNHYMESGLVLVNRKRHFLQPLVMSQLNFHLPVQARVYGDKELFWLALVIMGDENYAFNEHFLAAIGFSTPNSEWPSSKYGAKEICSNHPGHISDEDNHSLLWFNSGFRHCGQLNAVNFEAEFESKQRYTDLNSINQFADFFKNKLIIQEAVIPPHAVLEADNQEHEPSRSWVNMRNYCAGYTWCAYSHIGGIYNENERSFNNGASGLYIQFSPEEINKFLRIGDVWVDDRFIE